MDWLEIVERGNMTAINDLLDHGCDIDARGFFGETALMVAARSGHTHVVEMLLTKGANVHARDNVRWTAMTHAVIRARGLGVYASRFYRLDQQDVRAMELLLAAGGQLELREAIILEDVDLAQRICNCDNSLDINGVAYFSFDDRYLMLAARLGSLKMVDFLIRQGADVMVKDDLGRTALLMAAEAGSSSVVARLLDGSSAAYEEWLLEAALSEAETLGYEEVASLLRSESARRGA